jgi:flagellum-specific peptidoglycan hydrolase FlgJ
MITKTKHLVTTTMQKMVCKTNCYVRKDWFKWGTLVVIAWLLLAKNVQFNLSIGGNSTKENTVQTINEMPEAIQTSMTFEPPKLSGKPAAPPGKVKMSSKTANDFSNIAFVMNPTYAKRHRISPKVVAEKRAIVDDYLKRFVPVAKTEMNRYGIPASITLAQGLLESDAGGSRLAKQNNNHFGIKCFSRTCNKGHCANFTDDSHKDFFRVYKSAWESYRAHSLFLLKDRYKHLLNLESTDYKSWAIGLRKAGYATDKRYADKLINLIEALNLQKFDK